MKITFLYFCVEVLAAAIGQEIWLIGVSAEGKLLFVF